MPLRRLINNCVFNSCSLTSEGLKLQIYAEQIRKVMCEIDRAFHDNEMPTGKLNIGTVETITRLPETTIQSE